MGCWSPHISIHCSRKKSGIIKISKYLVGKIILSGISQSFKIFLKVLKWRWKMKMKKVGFFSTAFYIIGISILGRRLKKLQLEWGPVKISKLKISFLIENGGLFQLKWFLISFRLNSQKCIVNVWVNFLNSTRYVLNKPNADWTYLMMTVIQKSINCQRVRKCSEQLE